MEKHQTKKSCDAVLSMWWCRAQHQDLLSRSQRLHGYDRHRCAFDRARPSSASTPSSTTASTTTSTTTSTTASITASTTACSKCDVCWSLSSGPAAREIDDEEVEKRGYQVQLPYERDEEAGCCRWGEVPDVCGDYGPPARHPERPFSLDYINLFSKDFIELHGDRLYGDDSAIITGVGTIGENRVIWIFS